MRRLPMPSSLLHVVLGVVFMAFLGVSCADGPSAELSAEAQRGREVFLYQSTPTCGTCHVLADAKTRGALGPDLDELQADYDRVLLAVTDGMNLMPPQKGLLTPEQIEAVSRYVVEATGAASD